MRQFGQKYTILWTKEVSGIPWFLIFHDKITAILLTFCKKTFILLKHTVLMLIFCQKTFILSKTLCSYVYEKPPAVIPIFGPKNVNSVLTTLYGLWAKKVNRIPFFPIFHENITALMPIFCQQNVHSLKTDPALMPIFC